MLQSLDRGRKATDHTRNPLDGIGICQSTVGNCQHSVRSGIGCFEGAGVRADCSAWNH